MLFVIALSGVAMCAARADVTYRAIVTTGGGAGATRQPLTVRLKGKWRRTETARDYGGHRMRLVTLIDCASGRTWQLDPQLKLYSTAGRAAAGRAKITVTSRLKFVGTEKVAGLAARRYFMTVRTQITNCAEPSDTMRKLEVWVAPGLREATPNATGGCRDDIDPLRLIEADASACGAASVTEPNAQAQSRAFDGVILRLKSFDNGGRVTMTREVLSVSRAPLALSLFRVPSGYKKVSEADFKTAQYRALFEAMAKARR